MKFSELNLRPELFEAVTKIGYTDCTPIQDAVMPSVLKGLDVSGLAQTGTGKTAAFVIPLMERILRWKAQETGERTPANWKKNSFVLILVPTRELATQVEETISKLGASLGLKSAVIVGGAGYEDQKNLLRQNVEFVVGTPGRLLDLYKAHHLDLNSVGAIVFDEADRMFDMGFKDDMKFILRRVPRDRQFLLFSATLNFEVLNTAYQFGAEPVEFNVSRDQVTAEGIEHEVLQLGQDEKPMFLLSVLKKYNPQQCIVFSNFKMNVGRIARFLKENGNEAIEMSSLLSQPQRNKVIESFKTGKKQILVATDVAARGLDIKGIDLVVNYDLPDEAEGYVHRIGRTGRAGGSGKAIGFVSDRDVDALVRIEAYLKDKVKIGWMDEADLVKDFKPFPREDFRDRKPSGPSHGGGHSSGRPPQRPHQRPPQRQQAAPPQNQGPRPERPVRSNDNRPPRRDHPPRPNPKVNGHAKDNEQGPSNLSGQHRDRRLGRHGHKESQGSATNSQSNNRPQRDGGRPNQNRPRMATSHQNASAPARRPLRKHTSPSRETTASSKGIASKVKGFLSKIFK